MDRSADLLDFQASSSSDAIDFALPSERSYVPSHEAAANDATNENLDGCAPVNPRLTSVDELLQIDHWKPTESQFCKEVAAHYGQSKRNIQKWFVDLREIAPWFSKSELRLNDDRYTPLAVKLLGYRYFAGSKKKWESVLRELFADRVETWDAAQSAPAIRLEVLPRGDQRSSAIEVLSPELEDTLDALLAEFVEPDPVPFGAIALPSNQASITQQSVELSMWVKELEGRNTEIERELMARQSANAKVKSLIGGIGNKIAVEAVRHKELQSTAHAVSADETDIAKQLAEIQKMLGKQVINPASSKSA
jgi:hypothetical protein